MGKVGREHEGNGGHRNSFSVGRDEREAEEEEFSLICNRNFCLGFRGGAAANGLSFLATLEVLLPFSPSALFG